MIENNRAFAGVFRRSALATPFLYVVALLVACSPGSETSQNDDALGSGAPINSESPAVNTTGPSLVGMGGAIGVGPSIPANGEPPPGGGLGTSTGTGASGGESPGGVPFPSGSSSGGNGAGGALFPDGNFSGGNGAGGAAPPMGGNSSGGSAVGGAPPMGGNSFGGSAAGGEAGTGNPDASRSAGCGQNSTLTFGQVPGESGQSVGFGEGGYVTIQSGGQSRGFAMRLPDNYDNTKPYWLVFGFHWNGGNSKEVDTGGSNGYVMAHFGLQNLSNNGAIFVAPDGLNAGWQNPDGRDLQFVDDMLELIQNNYCVDTDHIFANGFSYGGGMSYAIACARANVFRGVAIYNGAVLSGCEGGNDPIALWQMAGIEDRTCTIEQAIPMRDRFVGNNGCTPQNPPQPPQGPPYLNPGGHICTDYEGCSDGNPIRWCIHQSGHGNAVVDGTSDLFNSCATPPNSCSDSCPCTWVPEDVWSWMNSF